METEVFKNLPSLRLCYNHGIITRQTGEGGNARYFTNLPLTYVGQFNHRFSNGKSSFTNARGLIIDIPYAVNNGFVATVCLPEEQEDKTEVWQYLKPLERKKDFRELRKQKYREARAVIQARDDGVSFGGVTHKRKRKHTHKRKHKRTKRK